MGNQTSSSQSGSGIIWRWKSNSDPWSKQEEESWTDYPPEITNLIEEAYAHKQKTVDIGDYQIKLDKMIQVRKDDNYCQRPVKRVEDGKVDCKLRSDRFFGATPNPKTINESFGNLRDFIEFLKKKSSRSQIHNLSELTLSSRTPIREICELITGSIVKEAQSLGKKYQEEAEWLINEFANPELLRAENALWKVIVRSYTKQTFLYSRVNSLLREEKWDKLGELLPYIYFLAIALDILSTSWIIKCRTELNPLKAYNTLDLYRGASIPTNLLSCYDTRKTKYFSWNAFTSTTKNKKVAKAFFQNIRKTGFSAVLFIIEVKRNYYNKNTKILEISEYSVYKHEEEVILPPGTVFELVSRKLVRNIYEINLRIVEEVENLYKNGLTLKGKALNSLAELKATIYREDSQVVLPYLTDQEINEVSHLLCQGKDFIKYICLKMPYLSPSGMTSFMQCISKLNHLEIFWLDGIPFSAETASVFSKYLPGTKIRALILNFSESANLINLIKAMTCNHSFKNLEAVDIDFTMYGTEQIKSEIPQIFYNEICHTNAKSLKITTTSTSLNDIREFGSSLIKNRAFVLHFSFSVGLNGSINLMKELVQCLPQSNIELLELDDRSIDIETLMKIINILPNTKISHVFLGLRLKSKIKNKYVETNQEEDGILVNLIIDTIPLTKIKGFGVSSFFFDNEDSYEKIQECISSLKIEFIYGPKL